MDEIERATTHSQAGWLAACIDYANQWAREVGVATQVDGLDARGLRNLLMAIRYKLDTLERTKGEPDAAGKQG